MSMRTDIIAGRVAKSVVSESKGTIDPYGRSVIFRKTLYVQTLEKFVKAAKDAAREFLVDIRLSAEQIAGVRPNDIPDAGIEVSAFQGGPGISVGVNISAVPDDQRWPLLESLRKKGYRIK